MNSWEKLDLPHAVYRFHGATGELLYVGASLRPFTWIYNHQNTQSWYTDVSNVTLEWYKNWLEAHQAEATAIQNEHPKYNIVTPEPEDVGKRRERGHPQNWMGVTCPRCSGYKPNREAAYCPRCTVEYHNERKRAAGWVPTVRTGLCPRCNAEPKSPNGYCRGCKKIVSKEARAKARGNG